MWSVPKPPTSGQPRVIRVLRRDDNFVQGRNWISWSRNGRILQFSEGETWAWDVRTKDVNYAPVPTIEYVQGIAAHGPSASLFTLGPEHTIQQYDIDHGQMVANVRHTPVTIPPTPPEDHVGQFMHEENASSPVRSGRYDGGNYRSRGSDIPDSPSNSLSSSKKSMDKKYNPNDVLSPAKTEQTTTTFSSAGYTYNQPQPQSAHPISPASSRQVSTLKKGSRLRQEVVMSPMTPEEALVSDLFPFARARLAEVQQQPKMPNESNMTQDELRKHMLAMVFGWEDDIYSLIEDEYINHPEDSLAHLFLSKWLENGSESVIEIMTKTPAEPISDWIRLALATLDNRPENKKIGQIFVEKMLSRGEIHMAAVAYLAMGDKNDAIEVYVSNNCYLEAILLTCLLMPQDWQRQSALVRKWGEHVVENSQQHLAIRCFACIGVEPAEAWFSPTAQMYSKLTSPRSAILYQPPMLPQPGEQRQQPQPQPQSPPQPQLQIQTQHLSQQSYQPLQQKPALSMNPHIARMKGQRFEAPTPVALAAPPTPFRAAAAQGTLIKPQTAGLKLITSFGQKASMFKFPGLKTDDMTPTAATNITPIAESAIDRSALSPGGLGSYRLNNVQSLNSAMSATARSRLPSIGEVAEATPTFPKRSVPRAPPTPADSGSDKEKEKLLAARKEAEKLVKQDPRKDKQEPALTLLTSARYNPGSTPVQTQGPEYEPQTALRPSTSASWHSTLNRVTEDRSDSRNGSRSKKPDGLALHLSDAEPISRPGTTDSMATNFALSPPVSGKSFRVKSPSVSGRSTDQYISSLDTAHLYGRSRSRNSSRAPKEDRAERKKSKHRKHKESEEIDRGSVPSGKRSPSSPIPMSPEDLQGYSQSMESLDSMYYAHAIPADDRSSKHARRESASTSGTGRRNRSRSAQPKRKMSLRGRHVEDVDTTRRGRSKSRKEDSGNRSPSSPLPMQPSEDDLTAGSGTDPAFKFVSQNRSRLQRSVSRRPERGTSSRRDPSPDRRRGRPRSPSRQREYEERQRRKEDNSEDYGVETSHQDSIDQLDALAASIKGPVNRLKARSKELAQAELEARRLSLARRPSAPEIPVPGISASHSKPASGVLQPVAPPLLRHNTDSILRPTQYQASLSRGRPGTPQAMAAPAEPAEETLSSAAYQLPARTYSANTMREEVEKWIPNEVPPNMPRHPAFDHRVGTSRGNSRSRTRGNSRSRNRADSRERGRASVERHDALTEEEEEQQLPDAMFIGIDSPEGGNNRVSIGPTIIPELQHLAVPPPPPPPPAPPKDLRIMTDLSNIASIPLPKSAYPGEREPMSATPDKPHKRVSSRNEGGQFIGKIRDRIRGNSKPRDNNARSPNIDDGIMSPYETVTMMPPPLSAITERR